MGGAVEMCSGLGACRKTLDGTMCPSYMATREEAHSTRGRANVLRLAMAGRLGESGLGDEGVHEVLDLCLECRACKAECPVGVDVARFKSEFLADYWKRHGTPLRRATLGHIHDVSRDGAAGSRRCRTGWSAARPARWLNERLLGIDRRRDAAGVEPADASRRLRAGGARDRQRRDCDVLALQRHVHQLLRIRRSGWRRSRSCEAAGMRVGARAERLLRAAADLARACSTRPARWRRANTDALYPLAAAGSTIRVFRAELPVGGAGGRAVAACAATLQRKARGVAERVGAVRGAASNSSARTITVVSPIRGPPEHPAPRPLPSEVDGTAGAGESAAVAHPGRHGRRSRCRLLRHGRIVRLRPRALRRVARDRRAPAAAGGATR